VVLTQFNRYGGTRWPSGAAVAGPILGHRAAFFFGQVMVSREQMPPSPTRGMAETYGCLTRNSATTREPKL